MKLAVIEIGSRSYLCPSVSVASKLMELLSKTVQVQRNYRAGQDTYTRDVEDAGAYSSHLEMRLVDASQVEANLKRVPEQRRLGYTKPSLEVGR